MTEPLISKSFSLAEIEQTANVFAKSLLKQSKPVIVGYTAEMGTGKTTFTGSLLRSFGLDKNEPVQSPTFTYVFEYEISGSLFAHLDLYRLESEVDLEELLGRSIDSFSVILIEWPEKAGGLKKLGCDFEIKAERTESENRIFSLFKI